MQTGLSFSDTASETLFVHDLDFSMTSDHHFIEFCVPFTRDPLQPKTFQLTYRDYKSIDIPCFCKSVSDYLCQKNFFSLDIESCAATLNEAFQHAIDKHAPISSRTVKKKTTRFSNSDIQHLRRKRRKFERRYRRFSDPSDKSHALKLHQDITKLVYKNMNEFYYDKLSKFKGNKRETFKIFNNILGNKQEKSLPCHLNEKQLCNNFEK